MLHLLSKLNIKRSVALLVSVFAIIACFSLPVRAESGKCGNELSWSFSAGTLVITGKGEMTNFTEPDMAPWYHLREEITRIVLPEGLTRIGNLAFFGCKNLKTAVIPEYVKRIGEYAFANCEKLEMLYLGVRVADIAFAAFNGCTSLSALRLPDGLERIGDQAFSRCESLVTVTIPINVKYIGAQAFSYCENLVSVDIKAYISAIPEWMFYGCENLSTVSLSPAVISAGDYAFGNCENLSAVYHQGEKKVTDSIKEDVVSSNPSFESLGYVGVGVQSDTAHNIETSEDTNGKVQQIYTTVYETDVLTLVTVVQHNTSGKPGVKGEYSIDMRLTLEGTNNWEKAITAVSDAISRENGTYSQNSTLTGTKLTVYLMDATALPGEFLKAFAGGNIKIEVVAPAGETWRTECEKLTHEEVEGDLDFTYTVQPSDEKISTQLGSESVYDLSFSSSSQLKSEILVQLPVDTEAYSNAYLYQVEEDGSLTRLQAVAVDENGNAHFYLATVDKDTDYVVGVNIPGETKDDVIIPDDLAATNNAIQRLEVIEYVTTGTRNFNGLTIKHITYIVIGVLAVTIVVVGVIMFAFNKQKQKAMRGGA